MSQKRAAYTSDLNDAEWQLIKPLLPLNQTGPGRPIELDMREVVNAIFYRIQTGCQWRNLPHDFPASGSVYYHYRKWCLDGTWQEVNETLRQQERQQRDRDREPTAGIVDSQSVKTTEAGGTRGYDAAKNVKGRKRHIVVDTVGNLLEVVVHAANIQDYDGVKFVLNKLSAATKDKLQKLWADAIYNKQKLLDWVHDNLDAILEIVERSPEQQGFEVLPRRWVVERTFAWLSRYRCLSKDYEHTIASSEGTIYAASIRTMLQRLAANC